MPSSSEQELLFQARFEPPIYREGLLVPQQRWFAPVGERACTVVAHSGTDHHAKVDGALLEHVESSYVAAYGHEVYYDPMKPCGKSLVRMSGFVKFGAAPGETACVAFGLCAPLCADDGSGEPVVPNALIGLRPQGKQFVSYMSNRNGVFVSGSEYRLDEWIHLEAVFDFPARVIRGYSNHVLMGQIPFTKGIASVVSYVTMAVITKKQIPKSTAFFDDLLLIAESGGAPRHSKVNLDPSFAITN